MRARLSADNTRVKVFKNLLIFYLIALDEGIGKVHCESKELWRGIERIEALLHQFHLLLVCN